jgi:hypothetical protein
MDYNPSPVNFSGDTASTDSINAPITDSQSFAESVKALAKPKMYTPSILGSDTPVSTKDTGGFDSLKMFGAGAQGLSALGSLLQAYNGYKQLQLGRDAFDFGKSTYNQDTANQARLTNSELEDRQRARIGSTGNNNANGTYESLEAYMARNRVTANPI